MSSPIIIFDLNRTLYDPERHQLVDHALFVLESCRSRGYALFLVSHNEPTRAEVVDSFGLRSFFRDSFFVDGKSPELFKTILGAAGANPADSFVIGDVVKSEILFGNICGMKTIWVSVGKFKDQVPQTVTQRPTYTTKDLLAILSLIPPV